MSSLSDEVGELVDTDPIALGQRCMAAEAEVERLRVEGLRLSALVEEYREAIDTYEGVIEQRDRYREALERIAAGPWSHTKHSSRAMVAIASDALDGGEHTTCDRCGHPWHDATCDVTTHPYMDGKHQTCGCRAALDGDDHE